MKFVPKAYFSILSETDFNQFYKIWCVKQTDMDQEIQY